MMGGLRRLVGLRPLGWGGDVSETGVEGELRNYMRL